VCCRLMDLWWDNFDFSTSQSMSGSRTLTGPPPLHTTQTHAPWHRIVERPMAKPPKFRRRFTVLCPIILMLLGISFIPGSRRNNPSLCLLQNKMTLTERLNFAWKKLQHADELWDQLAGRITAEEMSDWLPPQTIRKPHKLSNGFSKLEELEYPKSDSLTLQIAQLWNQAWKVCPPQRCAPILTQKTENDSIAAIWRKDHSPVALANWGLPGKDQLPDRAWLDLTLFPRLRNVALESLLNPTRSTRSILSDSRFFVGSSYWNKLKFGTKPASIPEKTCVDSPINVLFVGTRYYTHHYEASLVQDFVNGSVVALPIRYLSADIDPALEPWGSSQIYSHASYPVQDERLLKTFHLPRESLDVVILNGIWGENSDFGTYHEACQSVFKGLYKLLKPGGVAVMGWNKNMVVFDRCMEDAAETYGKPGFWSWFEPLHGWMGLPFETDLEDKGSDHTFHIFRRI
jgi:hypothetical protein